jgi:hypothetical protein
LLVFLFLFSTRFSLFKLWHGHIAGIAGMTTL